MASTFHSLYNDTNVLHLWSVQTFLTKFFPKLFATRGRLRAERDVSGNGKRLYVRNFVVTRSIFLLVFYGYGATALNCKLFPLAIFKVDGQLCRDYMPASSQSPTLAGFFWVHCYSTFVSTSLLNNKTLADVWR